jgi:CRISPR-associated protein Csm1
MTDSISRIADAALLHAAGPFREKAGIPAPDDHEAMLIGLAEDLAADTTSEQPGTAGTAGAGLCPVLAGIGREQVPNLRMPSAPHGDFDDALFMPGEARETSPSDFKELWQRFEKTARAVNAAEAPHATRLALMKRFTARIPAMKDGKRGANPDISLYEHSRIIAALAACFMADGMRREDAERLREALRGNGDTACLSAPFCRLVCGNLSGIQDFLYSVPRKGAAKTLKARSFLLQLVCESCAAWLCEETGLPLSCVIYNGGGRFYMLFPRSTDIDALSSRLEDHIMAGFSGSLAVLIGAVDLAPADFTGGDFSGRWKEAGQKASEKKLKKLSRPGRKRYDTVFGLLDESAYPVASFAPPGEDNPESDTDRRLAEFGRELRDARWLIRTRASENPGPENRFFSRLGFEYHAVADPDSMPETPELLEVIELGAFNPEETRRKLDCPPQTALSYRFLARAWPENDSGYGPATFEELAGRATGAKKLGIFRADVDNLGTLFQTGLGSRATITRTAMLSAALSDFFEGYVDALVQREMYRDKVGVIYTGGDDLFVVGAWDAVADFAIELRQAFTRYAGGNPALTFSGGIAIVEDHLPLRYAAELAHEAEETAKGYERNGSAKNALCLFGTPIGFEEMPRFLDFRKRLEDLLSGSDSEKPLPKGFLRRLYEVRDLYQRERSEIEKRVRGRPAALDDLRREARWKRWRWMLVYGLRDFAKKAPRRKHEIEEIQERILDEHNPIEDRLGVPLRWTELLLKKEEDQS